MSDRAFLTDRRENFLDGNYDLENAADRQVKSRLKKSSTIAFEELIAVAASPAIENEDVFETEQISRLLRAIMGDPEAIEPFYEAVDQGSEAREAHYEQYADERMLLNELRRIVMRYEERLERMQAPDTDHDLVE